MQTLVPIGTFEKVCCIRRGRTILLYANHLFPFSLSAICFCNFLLNILFYHQNRGSKIHPVCLRHHSPDSLRLV